MDAANQLILVAAVLFFAAVMLSAPASRIGAPLLLVFLGIGMLAGEDGPGGIRFDDYRTTYIVGSLALAVILFDGGLRTKVQSFRVGLRPALSLATVGVIITAGVTGALAAWVLGLAPLQGLLVGAIVGSTDAAAVFGLLHARGMALKERVSAVLEIESGSNDPMAIFLTLALVEAIASGAGLGWQMIPMFVQQMGLGAALGWGGGIALAWLINRVPLADALYPLLALSGGMLVFAVTAALGGSGFLAIYVAGIVMGNRPLHAAHNILRVHDGIAWLAQIVMFLVLGLLVSPSQLVDFAVPALVVAVGLMVLARPLAVWASLVFFRLPPAELAFVSWVGLRGAVPIVLALFPLMAGLPDANIYFNVAFFVVLVSLVCQGWTIAPLARRLGLELPPSLEALQHLELDLVPDARYDLLGYRITARSPAAGQTVEEVTLPNAAYVVAVIRAGRVQRPDEAGAFAAGDGVYVMSLPGDAERVSRAFAAQPMAPQFAEAQFFGAFTLEADARMADVCMVYGVAVPEDTAELTLRDVFERRFRGKAGEGDRVVLGEVELVVRAVANGRIDKVGLVLARESARS
jgi:cell volume regulation protein A